MGEPEEGSSNPNLELIVVNGPLTGQTFCFMPGSKVHIGRIVRGNSVTIKENAISSKHLSILFDLDIGRWMVSDLGSSNGTFLNGRVLDPFCPTELSDGDVIKIGELTSILVKWGQVVEKVVDKLGNVGRKACVKSGRGKKNARKLEENQGKDLESNMDKLSKNDSKGEEMVGPRVEPEKISGVCENLVFEQNEGLKMVTRGGRRKKEDLQEKISGVCENLVLKQNEGSKAVTRGRRKKEDLQEKISGVCEDLVLEQNEGSKMVTRCRRKKENLQVAMVELNERQEMSLRRTVKSMREANVLENHGENAGQADLKKRKGGRRGKQNVEAETLTEIVQIEKEEVILLNSGSKLDKTEDVRADNMPVNEVIEICERGAIVDPLVEEERVNCSVVEVEKDAILLNSGSKLDETENVKADNMPINEVIEICEGGAAIVDPLVKEELVNCSVVEGSPSLPSSKHHNDFGLDLENMTLGDLFDHWEVSLPKQIIDATELMISDMRQKSKKFHEFRLQHKSAQD